MMEEQNNVTPESVRMFFIKASKEAERKNMDAQCTLSAYAPSPSTNSFQSVRTIENQHKSNLLLGNNPNINFKPIASYKCGNDETRLLQQVNSAALNTVPVVAPCVKPNTCNSIILPSNTCYDDNNMAGYIQDYNGLLLKPKCVKTITHDDKVSSPDCLKADILDDNAMKIFTPQCFFNSLRNKEQSQQGLIPSIAGTMCNVQAPSKNNGDCTQRGKETKLIINPLTKEQLLQAIEYLLSHDPEFIDKIHDAYIKSLSQ